MSAAPRKQELLRGFTLIELLVAIALMAIMAGLSWRGLDGMARAQQQSQQISDETLVLRAGLAQWSSDLDSLTDQPGKPPLEWDGRSMRLLRSSMAADGSGLQVVAWARRDVDGTSMWLRWQSPPLLTRQQMEAAWQAAGIWAQNPGLIERTREVRIVPLQRWEVFYYRGGAWSNPLSSDATEATSAAPGEATTPEGIRLVLHLPPGHSFSGVLTRDWLNIRADAKPGLTLPPRVGKPSI